MFVSDREMIAYEVWRRNCGEEGSIKQFRRQRKYRRDEHLQLADNILSQLKIVDEWIDIKDKNPYDMWVAKYGEDCADHLVDTFNIYWGNDKDDPYATVGDYVSGLGWCYYGTLEPLPRQERISHWQKWRPDPPVYLNH